jgi:bacteriochlorophyll/chlorophyll synthetase
MTRPLAHPPSTNPVSHTRHLRAHVELADPVTWIDPVLMVIAGALAAGRGAPGFHAEDPRDLGLLMLAVLMCGPFGTGFSQSINDYFDRDLDAINDPARPIPSGRISLRAARLNWIALGLGATGIALLLIQQSPWIPAVVVLGLFLSVAYSVPPLKLKQRYWLGAPAVGLGYVLLCWLTGHLIFAPLTWPSIIIALISSIIAAALILLNDIKSVEGDRRLGLRSLAVDIGERRTLLVAYLIIGACELALLVLALLSGHPWAAALVALTILAPLVSQVRLYQEPTHRNFVRYMMISNPLIVLVQLVAAFIVGGYLR